MLQVDVRHYASDALEDAMRLAQTKALNSYTFSDCLAYLNYAWRDIYDRTAMIDDGYYGVNVRLTDECTRLPPSVKSTLQVYAAQSPVGYDRTVFRSSGATDMTSPYTYHISGQDLYVPAARRNTVWLYYVPACPQVFFTHHNRDPKILDSGTEAVRSATHGLFRLVCYDGGGNEMDITDPGTDVKRAVKFCMRRRNAATSSGEEDITELIAAAPSDDADDGEWLVSYISCDWPYIFLTYRHSVTGEHLSGFLDADRHLNVFNPFAFTGRNSDVEYVKCSWNDKTGMGAVIRDYNDLDGDGLPRVKELGWTPDTLLDYPAPEMYRYLVARLADKFSALNESNVMGVQKELVEAKYAFEAFLSKDKSSWKRITDVNPSGIGDWL